MFSWRGCVDDSLRFAVAESLISGDDAEADAASGQFKHFLQCDLIRSNSRFAYCSCGLQPYVGESKCDVSTTNNRNCNRNNIYIRYIVIIHIG